MRSQPSIVVSTKSAHIPSDVESKLGSGVNHVPPSARQTASQSGRTHASRPALYICARRRAAAQQGERRGERARAGARATGRQDATSHDERRHDRDVAGERRWPADRATRTPARATGTRAHTRSPLASTQRVKVPPKAATPMMAKRNMKRKRKKSTVNVPCTEACKAKQRGGGRPRVSAARLRADGRG
jgi:hypothetical protein